MAKYTIAVVEDEVAIARLMQINLNAADFNVTLFHSGEDFLAKMTPDWVDLVILDLMLPGIDGLEICRKLRQNPHTEQLPVLMVTARSEEIDRVVGLELGADDYMVKPFSVRELVARVKALLRRTNFAKSEPQAALQYANITLDTNTHGVLVGECHVGLSRKEFDLLAALMEHPGWVVTREQLLEQVWGYSYDGGTRTVDVHVGSLRKKLEEAAAQCSIETIRGYGYKLKGAEA